MAMRYATASMVKASIADGDGITTEMLDEIFDLMIVSGYEYDELTLAADLSAIDESALAGALRPLIEELTPHGKQGFLHRMVAIALADGALDAHRAGDAGADRRRPRHGGAAHQRRAGDGRHALTKQPPERSRLGIVHVALSHPP